MPIFYRRCSSCYVPIFWLRLNISLKVMSIAFSWHVKFPFGSVVSESFNLCISETERLQISVRAKTPILCYLIILILSSKSNTSEVSLLCQKRIWKLWGKGWLCLISKYHLLCLLILLLNLSNFL